jgi:oligoendopeptidase F
MPGYETFWAYIPHFIHSPFYVYAYAFGDCLVNSLYASTRKSASGFAERYFAQCSRPAAPSTIPSCSRRSGSMPATRASGRSGWG